MSGITATPVLPSSLFFYFQAKLSPLITPTVGERLCHFRIAESSNYPKLRMPVGNLTFVEASNHVPLEIKRVYYLYDVPGGSHRGAHAHRNLQQFVWRCPAVLT
jgi:WxcM-like, C-terminal.